MLAEQVLQNARLSDDQVLMVRTVERKDFTVEAVCQELVAQHVSLHQKEKRQGLGFKGKGSGCKGFRGQGRGKGYGYYAESQSLGGPEDDAASHVYQSVPDDDYADGGEEAILQAFGAMVSEGGFQNKKDEFRGEVSIEDRKARISSLKERTACKRCGQKGHSANDPSCPKGSGMGRRPKGHPASASTSSTTTAGSKGTKSKGKPGSNGWFSLRSLSRTTPQAPR